MSRTNYITSIFENSSASLRSSFQPAIIIGLLFFIISLFLFPIYTTADNLSSPSFRIQMGTINITGGQKSGGGFKLSDTVGQTAQGQFDSAGFRIRAGFQYVRTGVPFSFKVNSLAVNFGLITSNVFYNATNTLTVTSGGAYGYTVKAIQDHKLTIQGGADTIPSTTCDIGLPCTTSTATPWTVASNYGFGYNMSGSDVDTTNFVNGTYFAPFPDNSLSQSPITIMSRTGITRGSTATVNYRLSVSGTQTPGTYQNGIQYIAVPAY